MGDSKNDFDDLRRLIYETYFAASNRDRDRSECHWVVGPETWDEIRKIPCEPGKQSVWEPLPGRIDTWILLDKPVEVSEHAEGLRLVTGDE